MSSIWAAHHSVHHHVFEVVIIVFQLLKKIKSLKKIAQEKNDDILLSRDSMVCPREVSPT